MKPLTILSPLPALFFFLLIGWQPTGTIFPAAIQYCNDHYNFCVKYPSSLLPVKELMEEGNGIILKTYDESSIVTVEATGNGKGITPKELFEATIHLGGQATVLSSVFGSDYSEYQFLKGDWIYYHHGFFFEKHYVILLIKVPVNKPGFISRLREDVQVSIKD